MSRSLLTGQFTKHNSGLGLTLATLVLVLLAPAGFADWVSDARPLMGTEVSVYLWSDDPAAGRLALEEVFVEVARIDRLMSTYKDESEISKINREAASGPVAAGGELFGLIQRSLDISVLTRGAFDITFDSVGQHYDFRSRQRPDAGTVQQERRNIDYRLVQLDRAAGCTETPDHHRGAIRDIRDGLSDRSYLLVNQLVFLRETGKSIVNRPVLLEGVNLVSRDSEGDLLRINLIRARKLFPFLNLIDLLNFLLKT